MAATLFTYSVYFYILLLPSAFLPLSLNWKASFYDTLPPKDVYWENAVLSQLKQGILPRIKIQRLVCESKFKLKFPLIRSTKHGSVCLSLPSKPFEMDTI